MATQVDVIVVGAGISGLAFSSVYLNAHPTAELIIIEKEARRLYSHFWTQWPVGFAEFSDKPMVVPPEEDQYCGFFKAEHTSNYLEEYATGQMIMFRTLKDRIKFCESVTSACQVDSGWEVKVVDTRDSRPQTYLTAKLIVASGLTSIPNIPLFNGSDMFGASIIHTLDFGSSTVLTDPQVKNVTILGGGKSAADMAYACVKAGKEVAWIVRGTGVGPCNFIGAQAATRAAELLQPSFFTSKNVLNRLLHQTRAGQAFSNSIWTHVNDQALAEADYDKRPARQGFEKLRPHTSLFWENTPTGFLNHEDFYDVIAKNVIIHYDEIDSSNPTPSTSNPDRRSPQTAPSSAPAGAAPSTSSRLPSGQTSASPTQSAPPPSLPPDQLASAKHWSQLEHDADSSVTAYFPALANPPPHFRAAPTHTPLRLYKLTVPADDPTRSFACIGHLVTTNYFRTGEAQSFWATAYLDGTLALPPVGERKAEIARFVAWNRRRYLSNGEAGNGIAVDTLRYTDRLLAEVGLTAHLRKGWFGRVFAPNRAGDYRGLREEFNERFQMGRLREMVADLHGR